MKFNFHNNRKNGREIAEKAPSALHPVTLSFKDADLNQAFEKYTTLHSLSFVRTSLSLAIGLYVVFGFLDPLITPEILSELIVIRVINCIIFAGVIYLTYTDWGLKNFQFMMSMVLLVAGLGLVSIIALLEITAGYHHFAGIILAIMYAHGLLRLRFIYASIITWFVILAYITAIMYLAITPFEVFIINIFFLLSANIMGMIASYWLEYYMKAGYLNEQIVHEKSDQLKVEYDRKSNELESARRLQLKMLPQKFPYCPNYEFAFSMKAASEVGGDYYDYHRTEDEVLTFGIGDATGHGLQASVMVTAIKLLFAEHAVNSELTDFLKRASHSISLMDFRKLYMAFAIGRLRDNTLELGGAGMPPALIYRYKTNSVEQIPLKGLPLGSKAEFPYKKVTTEIEPGDAVMFMTDGLPELFNRNGDMIGYKHVAKIFAKAAHLDPDSILNHLNTVSESWLNGHSQNDDMTFFIFKRRLPVTHTQEIKDPIPDESEELMIREELIPNN
ncbi:SpoIIE family protein phosphatase [Aliifodinibius sp. S!AR15-10]|uniref:PP2C family protein-serine/threonine phosphatase n=1 Tax=Aliifodinibius sp. S!AR15-10 TaxID=2950437 RepID=UPI0028573F4E|nr:SpoIIE family protein phosphatase [Aliifodinibius sp. S!AR15-10]MDR8389642.1 SpoIIE family protein phosphatase [Aliifodinibius sp. S!AR15-10]